VRARAGAPSTVASIIDQYTFHEWLERIAEIRALLDATGESAHDDDIRSALQGCVRLVDGLQDKLNEINPSDANVRERLNAQ